MENFYVDDWSADVIKHSIAVTDGEIFAAELGPVDGPVVVFYHSLFSYWGVWLPIMAALANYGYRSISIAPRGFGKTTLPCEPKDLTSSATVGDYVAVLDALGIGSAVVVAHDLTAMTAWDMPHLIPKRIKGLVAVGLPRPRWNFESCPSVGLRGLGPIGDVDGNEHSDLPVREGIGSASLTFGKYVFESSKLIADLDMNPRESLRRMLYVLSGRGSDEKLWLERYVENNGCPVPASEVIPELPWQWMPLELFNAIADEYSSRSSVGAVNWYRAFDHRWQEVRDDPRGSITHPVMFIFGQQNQYKALYGEWGWQAWQSTITNPIDLVECPDAGHWPHLEAAEQVIDALVRFCRIHHSGPLTHRSARL